MLLSDFYNSELLNQKGFILQNKDFPIDAKSKTDFILEHVYPKNRTFYNWLLFESLLKDRLDQIVVCIHSVDRFKNKDMDSVDKTFILEATSYYLLDKFLKFHPTLILNFKDNISPEKAMEGYFDYIDRSNKAFVPKNNNSTLYYNADILYQPNLDIKFYNDLISFFNISNEFEYACTIHNAWFEAQERSRNGCIEWIKNSAYPDFPWDNYHAKAQLQGKNFSEEDFNIVKKCLRQIYDIY